MLDAFTQGYIDAILFTECAPGTKEDFDPEIEGNLHGETTEADFSEELMAQIKSDCLKFQASYIHLPSDASKAGMQQAHLGHDFWLTRNNQGTGFWDRTELGKKLGTLLTTACRKFGSFDVYLGDNGKVYGA